MAAVRCCGMTRSGQPCRITSSSSMRDSAGRLVAEPLRKGARFCLMHTILFPREPVMPCAAIVAYIDLETNSLDVLSGGNLNAIVVTTSIIWTKSTCGTTHVVAKRTMHMPCNMRLSELNLLWAEHICDKRIRRMLPFCVIYTHICVAVCQFNHSRPKSRTSSCALIDWMADHLRTMDAHFNQPRSL